MAVSEDTILKITKEIVVKFIEMGRISPASFPDSFQTIYSSIKNTVERANLLSVITDESEKSDKSE
ncbi:MAG TPA: conjugal transfer protein TraB [Deltaproteobacteria bacterium]|nr:MAG: conjugal transfer protein TraB [Deltaproteobacteria bacterium]RLB09230.1 MAG: conjugal transfer protein TraB [Deltaproteobacteria bacterium]HDM76110.1 conjugal transfer protein TraB [Deltaproteobacteria bacterium]